MGRIGIMGGTFDPIHNGHILIGKQAYEEYHLDEIWFMPSGQPPHKKDHIVTDSKIRCEMTKLAIAEYPYFVFSDFEVERKGNTYTAKTLKLLTEAHPEHTFYFIIGADSLFQIETWYHPHEVMALAVIMVAGRDYKNARRTMDEQIQYLSENYKARILRLHSTEIDIASAQIRMMAARGIPLDPYVPQKVLRYIKDRCLYQNYM
ncbi:nicotinate-nucleotide adenylyltransferase [Clostridium sp. AM58-1XD]|uniref:nicotinate-nucleotide adenylyltransferase n=1 Tax=Clostridium sp. AM58-1XD TaxID=2292307 RepID=UPI000E4AD754|nr:nicotinate-nucleotide adenylyltransferase [Clostridium sp. AM58-1XD]RGY95270.1 nicotinate-nucleotide adenylyltransferase [Clostridium sp. AM58-1XD]